MFTVVKNNNNVFDKVITLSKAKKV